MTSAADPLWFGATTSLQGRNHVHLSRGRDAGLGRRGLVTVIVLGVAA